MSIGHDYDMNNMQKHREAVNRYRLNNLDKIRLREKIYKQKNKAKISEISREYRVKNRAKIRLVQREWNRKNYAKMIKNPLYKFSCDARSHVRYFIKMIRSGKYKNRLIYRIGCDINTLKIHMESQFYKGMTWNNYSKKWHIDHITPFHRFDLSNDQQRIDAQNYKNIQPLLKDDHREKTRGEMISLPRTAPKEVKP